MPKKHLKGVSEKEQRQYEHIKESAEKSERYGKRAKCNDPITMTDRFSLGSPEGIIA
jgi:hypothetical protein